MMRKFVVNFNEMQDDQVVRTEKYELDLTNFDLLKKILRKYEGRPTQLRNDLHKLE